MKNFKAFTLIELLVVIVIIGILATQLITKITSIQAKTRDIQRLTDMRQIQIALEMYYADKGSYPETLSLFINGRLGGKNCGYYDNSSGNYVPGLVPTYLISLPVDPRGNSNYKCYQYKSDGKDYSILAHTTVEGVVPIEYQRPLAPTQKTFAIYTSGAKMW